jgi:CheY-like chemotaxis protein
MLQLMKRPGIAHAMTHRNQRGSRHDSPVDVATRILIVDNDRGVGTALTFMLAARGYDEVRAVRSARRALALAELYRPALVFLDLELPEEGALEVASRLRTSSRLHALRLIALTNDSEHETRETARVAGFERYLVKPLTQSELDKVLHRAESSVLKSEEPLRSEESS